MAKTGMIDPNAINIICEGTSIRGDISTSGEIRIDGTLEGTLVAKGKLVVGTTGKITGEITCKNADVQGKIEGKISVTDLFSLKSTSSFVGEVTTRQIAIEPGAIFNGTCQMKTQPEANEQKK